MGLERMAAILQGGATNYDTDLCVPIHDRMRQLLGHDPEAFESERFSYQVIADHSRAQQVKSHPKAAADNPKHVAAPMPGRVVSVHVSVGQAVEAGDRLAVLEAMKMEHALLAARDGTVAEVLGDPLWMQTGDRRNTFSSRFIKRKVLVLRFEAASEQRLDQIRSEILDALKTVGGEGIGFPGA